jgi:DNA-binding response OmpR family regulator
MQGRFRRVLVVDDERFFREAIQETLTDAGLECLLAADGSEALEMSEEPSIGAVVLDVRLPGMDGIEVLRRLRQLRPHLPVIMLSAHQDQTYVLDALRQGAADYLAKPLHEEELVLAVRRALDGHDHAATSDVLRERLVLLQQAAARLVSIARGGESARDELYAALAQAAAEVVGAEKTSLMLLDETGSELRVVAATGRKLAPEQFEAVPVGEAVAGLALARSEPLLVTELSEDARFAERQSGDRYASQSFAVAPIVAGDRALGVICATDASDGTPLRGEDLALLRVLAEQAASLLQVSQPVPVLGPGTSAPEATTLPLEASGGSEDGEIARAVCEAIVAEVEPVRVLSGALAAVGEGIGACCAALHLRAADGTELVCEGVWNGDETAERERLPLGRGLTGTVLETGRPVATDDPTTDPRFDPEVDTPASGEVGPFLCLPMRFRGVTLGVFRAFLAPPARTSPRVGEVLTAALSVTVRNVLLYRSLVESIEEVARARREARG